MHRFFAVVSGIVFAIWPALGDSAEPRVLVEGYALEQVAKEPDIVTPIGMAFDGKGRLLVVESHTHQRPENYEGPAGDRIRMFSDSDGDGRLDAWSTFAEGFQQSMNLCVRPDGGVYVVTRRDVRLLEDADGDGKSDKETPIVRLETEADYPHNGLSGIHLTTGPAGRPILFLGLGENFGFPYKLVGSDGVAIEGRGGVGTIFTCQPDGSKLERFAIGFWNPFSITTAHGRTYCVDNDPDASPPCRLIEAVLGGDYGHRWEYGRAGVHPLQAWNAELPGTLPMICGTGEAPTALVSHDGALWVTSWGDHRIERYTLAPAPRSAALGADSTIVVQGDADFRPTGMAVAPDGSLYFADWVDRSYPVHGAGRIWRLTLPKGGDSTLPAAGQAASMTSEQYLADPFARHRIVQGLLAEGPSAANDMLQAPQLELRLSALEALRFLNSTDRTAAVTMLRDALDDDDPDVRLYAVRWIADERIAELRDDVAKLLDGNIPTERYLLAVLAAIEWLDGDASPRAAGISDGLLRRELANEKRSPKLHALALQLISPDHEWLTIDHLRGYLASDSPELRLEAVCTLAMQTRPERFAVLAEIAADESRDASLRAEAVAGLASAAGEYESLLTKLADGAEPVLTKEAERVLRLSRKRAVGAGVDPEQDKRPEPTDLEAWNALLAEGGDAESGRRLFFTSPGPLCAACHQHGGRGGRVGPDLTRIGLQQSRERIIASILQPNQEIAPHYQAWELVTDSGQIRVGLRLPKAGDDGVEPYADAEGRRFELKSEEIELRTPSSESIMPGGLVDGLTIEDLRDLMAFLSATD